jgi:hypothetical protein
MEDLVYSSRGEGLCDRIHPDKWSSGEDISPILGRGDVGFELAMDHCTVRGVGVSACWRGPIQPFGWICIIIAWGRKSQKNPSDLNMVSTL